MSTGAAIGSALLGVVALMGCQTLDFGFVRQAEPASASAPAVDPAEARLEEAAVRAERALTLLAETRSAAVDVQLPEIPTHVPPELLATVDLDLLGPLEMIVARLADAAGYSLIVAGPPPPAPVLVELAAQDRALIHALRDAGLQAADRALLTVDAGRMTVRLDWIGSAGRGAVRRAGDG